MARRITTLWKAIERWFLKHAGPEYELEESDSVLGAPATEAQVSEAEALLGVKFPADVRRSYLAFNGSEDRWLLEHGVWSPLQGVCDTWSMLSEGIDNGNFAGLDSEPKGPIKPDFWNKKWIPIAENGGGDVLCVDLDPAKGGTVGQIIWRSHEVGPTRVLAPSLYAYLEEMAAALESKKLIYDYYSIYRRADTKPTKNPKR